MGAKVSGFVGGMRDKVVTFSGTMRDRASAAASTMRDRVSTAAGSLRDRAVSAVSTARDRVSTAMGNLRDRAGSAAATARDRVVSAAGTLRDRAVSAFSTARDRVSTAMGTLRDRAGAAASTARDRVVTAAGTLRDKAVSAVSTARDRVSTAMGTMRDKAAGAAATARDKVATAAGNLRDKAAAAVNTAKERVTESMGRLRDNSRERADDARTKVVGALTRMRDQGGPLGGSLAERFSRGLGTIKGLASVPIKFVYNTILGGLVRGFNKVWDFAGGGPDKIKLPNLGFSVGGIVDGARNAVGSLVGGARRLLGFAKGGVLPGYAPGRDTVPAFIRGRGPALLSPGEGILVPEAVRGLARMMGTGTRAAVQAINSSFSRRVKPPREHAVGGRRPQGQGLGLDKSPRGHAYGRRRRFANGGVAEGYALGGFLERVRQAREGLTAKAAGIIDAVTGAVSGAKNKVVEYATGIKDLTLDSLRKSFGVIADPLLDLLRRGIGSTGIGDMAEAAVRAVIERLKGGLDTQQEVGLGGDAGGAAFGSNTKRTPAGRGGLGPMAAYVRRLVFGKFPAIKTIGGYAYRTIAGTNTLSDHATGHAADIMVPDYRSVGGIRLGDSIARWILSNWAKFHGKYLIWRDKINSGAGWRPYGHPGGGRNDTLQHRDHLHLSVFGKGGLVDQIRGAVGGLARGGTVRPRSGGTLARLAEAGRAETVVDEGLMNRLMERVLNGDLGGGGALVGGDLVMPVQSNPHEAISGLMFELRRLSMGGVHNGIA